MTQLSSWWQKAKTKTKQKTKKIIDDFQVPKLAYERRLSNFILTYSRQQTVYTLSDVWSLRTNLSMLFKEKVKFVGILYPRDSSNKP